MQKIKRSLDNLDTKKNKVGELTFPHIKTFTKIKTRKNNRELDSRSYQTKNEFWVL